MNIPKELTKIPCIEAIEYFKTQKNKKSAWDNCNRGDWMWWALLHSDIKIENIQSLCDEFILDCKTRAYAKARACAEAYADAYAYADARVYADACVYADADAYARAYARAYAYADTHADAYADAHADAEACASESKKQAEWIKLNIPYPFGK